MNKYVVRLVCNWRKSDIVEYFDKIDDARKFIRKYMNYALKINNSHLIIKNFKELG